MPFRVPCLIIANTCSGVEAFFCHSGFGPVFTVNPAMRLVTAASVKRRASARTELWPFAVDNGPLGSGRRETCCFLLGGSEDGVSWPGRFFWLEIMAVAVVDGGVEADATPDGSAYPC